MMKRIRKCKVDGMRYAVQTLDDNRNIASQTLHETLEDAQKAFKGGKKKKSVKKENADG